MNSNVIQLISMLLCIAVVVCFFIFNYNRGVDVQDSKAKVQKLHLFYISGILVFIIIELATGLCMGNAKHDDILSYVNFAATLSSLIMSVVAIIFTIVSGSRGDEQYKKIDNASDKVAESLAKFSEQTNVIDASISSFKSSTDALTTQMDTIIELVSGVDKTSRSVLEYFERAQSSERGLPERQINPNEMHGIQDFVNISSYSGRMALYACVLSKDTGKPFNVKDVSENADDEAYKYGYIIASVASGVIRTKPTNDRLIEVESYFEGLKELLEASIQMTIDSITNESAKQSQIQRWEDIKKVFE